MPIQYLREVLLQEVVRMGEPALMPMQHRWVCDTHKTDVRIMRNPLTTNDIRDLVWIQKKLGADIIDLYHRGPNYLPKRLDELRKMLKGII